MTTQISEAADVDRGIELYALITQYEAELKAIEERMKARALEGDQIPLEDADREGTQYIAQGTTQKVPIIITADSIMKELTDTSPALERVRDAAGEHFKSLYKRWSGYRCVVKDGKDFRAMAARLLESKAPAFITACIARKKDGLPKNSVKVMWSREQEATPEEPSLP